MTLLIATGALLAMYYTLPARKPAAEGDSERAGVAAPPGSVLSAAQSAEERVGMREPAPQGAVVEVPAQATGGSNTEITLFLWADGSGFYSGGDWSAKSTDGSQEHALGQVVRGRAQLPPGTWTLENLAEDDGRIDGEVRISRSARNVLLVDRIGALRVRVVDEGGAAIALASVYWISKPTPQYPSAVALEEKVILAGTTNRDGYLPDPVSVAGVGDLVIAHRRYGRWSKRIQASPNFEVVAVLLPARNPSQRTLRFTNSTGEGQSGIRAESGDGLFLGKSGLDGAVVLPDWIAAGDSVLLSGACYPSIVNLEGMSQGESRDLVVFPRVPGTVRFTGGSERAVHIEVVAVDDLPADCAIPFGRRLLHLDAAGSAQLSLPAGCRVQLWCSNAAGEEALEEVVADAPGWERQIALNSDRALVINCRLNGVVQLDTAAVVLYRLGRAEQRFEADDGGSIVVPGAEAVAVIDLRSPHADSLTLSPRPSSSHSGVLELELSQHSDSSLRVVDEFGEAVPGMLVSVTRRPTKHMQWPELHGAEPTAHPGWAKREGESLSGVSDAEGIVVIGGATGLYNVRVDGLPGQDFIGSGPSVSDDFPWTLKLPLDSPLELRVFRSRLITIQARLEGGGPLMRIQLAAEGSARPFAQAMGSVWQGWCDSQAREVVVLAPGQGRVKVHIPQGADDLELDAVIPSGQLAKIVVKGYDPILHRNVLSLSLYGKDGGGTYLLYSTEVELNDVGEGAVVLVSDEEYMAMAQMESWTGGQVSFSADSFAIASGRTVTIEVTE